MTLPKVKCLVPSPDGYVLADDVIGRSPIRVTRREDFCFSGPVLSYGQYFEGITDLISRDGYRLLVDAAARQQEKHVCLADIEEIRIYAEKHGSDYHPARIKVKLEGEVCITFVMNVAMTPRGKAHLPHEFAALQYLHGKYGFAFLPRAYFRGETAFGALSMFLADWFEGYHEFHLSMGESHRAPRPVLWDAFQGPHYLTRTQVWQVYEQAALILTLYYDLDTFEQIFPWHHAAGDFVVKIQQGRWIALAEANTGDHGTNSVEVRLVTARQYASMMEPSQGVTPHEALLFFLLNLSLRMQLDRLDGTGPVAWADDDCLGATLEGFLEGLRIKQARGLVDGRFMKGFVQYVDSFSKEDLSERFHVLVETWDPSAPDMPVIREHLGRHIQEFHSAFKGRGGGPFVGIKT